MQIHVLYSALHVCNVALTFIGSAAVFGPRLATARRALQTAKVKRLAAPESMDASSKKPMLPTQRIRSGIVWKGAYCTAHSGLLFQLPGWQ